MCTYFLLLCCSISSRMLSTKRRHDKCSHNVHEKFYSSMKLQNKGFLLKKANIVLKCTHTCFSKYTVLYHLAFPGGSVVQNLPANARDLGLIPGLRRSNGNPLQYPCPGNPMVRGAWWAASMESQRVRQNLVTKQPTPLEWGMRICIFTGSLG